MHGPRERPSSACLQCRYGARHRSSALENVQLWRGPEAVTEIGRSGVSDALYDEARAHFTDKELVDLTVAVIAINAWNRLAVTFRPAVGTYKPAASTTAASA